MNIHTPQLVPRISQQVQDQAPALDMPPTPQQVLKASHWATMARLHAGVDVHDFTTGTVLATIYSTVSCSQLFVTVPAAGKGEVYLRTRAYEQEVMSAALAGTDGPCSKCARSFQKFEPDADLFKCWHGLRPSSNLSIRIRRKSSN